MNSDNLLKDQEIWDATKQINAYFIAHDNTLRCVFVQTENAALQEIEKSFIKMRESGDMVGMIVLEMTYLQLQMAYNKDLKASEGEPHALDGVEKTRVSNGHLSARTAVEMARGIDSYERYADHLMFASNVAVDRDGLPKDGFRVFIYNQCKALLNNMGAELIDAAKSRNKERIKNLRVAEDLYRQKQHQHLERFSQEHPEHALAIKYLSKHGAVEPES
ncbi:MAG: hypothetical protein IJ228_07405 [Succinivibrio sp.]|nr:hypothetical protein [Succinivibrio sp.]